MKYILPVFVLSIGICVGIIVSRQFSASQINAGGIVEATPTPSISTQSLPAEAQTILSTASPPVVSTVKSPVYDIIESIHISSNKSSVQVGEDIGFSVSVKNQASYRKHIVQLCFNSTDGNFGC